MSAAGSSPHGALELPPVMESVLRPHQVSALNFVWERLVVDGTLRIAARTFSSTIEQRTRLYQEVFGAILAHSMGLGKTLTSISFVLLFQAQATLMAAKRDRARQQQLLLQKTSNSSAAAAAAPALKGAVCPALRVLVLCPRSCVLHWQASIAEWVHPRYAGTIKINTYVPSATGVSVSSAARGGARSIDDVLLAYHQQGGVLLLGYEEYQRLLAYAHAHHRSNPSTTWPRVWSLLDRLRLHVPLYQDVRLLDLVETADLVILDEAHRLRRSSSQLVTALTQHLRHIQLRLALTGTPLQNHLEEYNTMQSILTGRELDTQLFYKHFIAPIERGQCVDASYPQFLEMQRCIASLRRYFADSAHHCGPEVLAETLPPRREFLFFFRLSAAQESAYHAMLQRFGAQVGRGEKGDSVLQLHHVASHICLHPALGETEASGRTSGAAAANDDDVEEGDGDEDGDAPPPASSSPPSSPTTSAATLAGIDVLASPKLSFAVALTVHVVRDLREKVVVFSQYLSHLRLFAQLLAGEGIAALSLTGTSSDAERRRCITELQTSEACRVLLCSVRAGGVGIKLTAANHCILLDVSWNPADDVQATYRLYRYGQLRPVSIYRLATWGTSEHVVFAYALQKSWLQKKIADIRDPRRQQRHQTRSYFRYPCAVPLPGDDDVVGLVAEEPASAPRDADAERRRVAHMLELCAAQCPAAAHVLQADPAQQSHLCTVIAHSTLLRHNEEDVIRERGRRFEEAVLTSRASVAVPLQMTGGASAQARDDASPLDACEAELVDAARQAAHLIIARALHARAAAAAAAVEADGGGDTVSEVRTLDERLCHRLRPLVAPVLAARPPPRFLAEVLLLCYQAGARDVFRTLLQSGAYLKMRTTLASRVPATGRRRPRDAALPSRSPLEEALLFFPVSLLRTMSAVEATYITTELGCDRPLVGSCMLRGLRALWCGGSGGDGDGRPVLSDANIEALAALLGLDSWRRWGDSDDEDGAAAEAATGLAAMVLSTLVGGVEEQWPPYEGFALPPLPLQLKREEGRMAHAYSAASRAHGEGLLPLAQVAELLRLPCYRQGQHMYGCARCRSPLLQRLDATHLECPRCHFNAEFEIRADPRTQQQTVLYQLSMVANLLDAFSVTKSFAVSFSPAKCADVSAALREVNTSQAAFEFVRRAMEEGVHAFLTEYPPQLVRLLGLQVGTGGDVEELRRVLLANGRLASHTSVREHVRQRLAATFADMVRPSALTQFTAMPLMFFVTALHHLAECEQLTYAHELLVDECLTPRRRMLRFASDALVKVLYVERLLKYCRKPPPPPLAHTASAPATTPATAAAAAAAAAPVVAAAVGSAVRAERGGASDSNADDVVSLRSLLMAASSSEASRSTSSASYTTSSASSREGSAPRPPPSKSSNGGVADNRHRSHRSSSSSSSADSSGGGGLPSSSSSSPSRSSSSSYRSVYSGDRASFPDGSASDDETGGATALESERPPGSGTWLEELARSGLERGAPTAEELEGEAVQQQRSAQYWVAFCEVYGTHSAETLTVFIEDTVSGVKALRPPPLPLWIAQVAHTTMEGRRVTDMLDDFFRRLLDLSQQVRVIA
ncbi:SNF2 family N-terminal domain/Helicase conserved C-terminal domain containing protein [Novymonas esmeraldas]|uniref:SNF2 family N-terminal domain/Helicase conserved C-terminal domain containing protein n=1 Tax=Novymonas esmeraldas TaxID=1808958 RepID=A0AAW0ETS2_9TRYP